MVEHISSALEELAEYLKNIKKIELWPIKEANRKNLYDNIKEFFDKESKLELKLIYEANPVDNINDEQRVSFYIFKRGPSVEISDLEDNPAISVGYDNMIILKNKAYLLLNSIKESLGIELSIKEL